MLGSSSSMKTVRTSTHRLLAFETSLDANLATVIVLQIADVGEERHGVDVRDVVALAEGVVGVSPEPVGVRARAVCKGRLVVRFAPLRILVGREAARKGEEGVSGGVCC